MFGCGNRRDCVDLIRIGIHPALPLILHGVGGLRCDFAPVIALDHAQRQIDARRKAACCGEVPVFNEPRAALELNFRKLHREPIERRMKCGRALAIQ